MGEIKQCDGSRADLQPDTGRLCKRTAAFPTASSTKSIAFDRFYKIYYLLCFLQDIIPATRFTKATTYYMFYKIYNLLYVKQNGHILPTGQWYAPSSVINDAWYCMVLLGIAGHCIIVHSIAWYCMVLHRFAWYCMVLHCIALYCMVLHCIA